MNTITAEMESQPRTEGPIARAIESRTSKLPSDIFLWAAGGAVAVSLVLQMLFQVQSSPRFVPRSRRFGALSLLVGEWVPTLLVLGLYNKLVKIAGSDRVNR